MAKENDPPVPLEKVLEAERAAVQKIRDLRQKSFLQGDVRPAAAAPKAPIAGRASPTLPEWRKRDKAWVKATTEAHKANFVGLAFSGGGIRSATFNLGVLQGLAELKLLHRVDYLSTVSGGGYIGAWLAAWTKRVKSFAEVQKRLATNRVHQVDDKEPTPVRFLRVFSNYLTPKLGIFSGDTWAMVAIYLRNMLLNQVIVLAMVATALLLPRVVVRLAVCARDFQGGFWSDLLLVISALLLILLAVTVIANNMRNLEGARQRAIQEQLTRPGWILLLAGLPLFLSAILAGAWLVVRYPLHQKCNREALSLGGSAAAGAAIYVVIWILATVVGSLLGSLLRKPEAPAKPADDQQRATPQPARGRVLGTLLGAAGAGALAGWLYALISEPAKGWSLDQGLTLGGPLVLGVFLLAGTLHIGLMGVVFRDPLREWWGRLGGWLMLWGLIWTALFWVALFFPYFIQTSPIVKSLAAKYLTPTWILTTVGGLLAAKSKASGKPGTQTWRDVLAKVAPYAFAAGLFCWVSWCLHWLQAAELWCDYAYRAPGGAWGPIQTGFPCLAWASNELSWAVGWLLVCISKHRLIWAVIGSAVVALGMSWRVDINLFSMHLFYRNRLVRCYLGASNEHRSPNRFTGFDPADDLPLKTLTAKDAYDGPYPVVNAALNLVKGKDLAWQERMAESFVMTPEYCGYDVWLEEQDSPMISASRAGLAPPAPHAAGTSAPAGGTPAAPGALAAGTASPQSATTAGATPPRKLERYGYRPTASYAFPPPHSGLNLGIAIGISGAAASPNMGFYSSTPVAFLMTVFNVRLGQWLGNPRHRTGWLRPTPVFGLPYLVNELVGGTDDDAKYVYLSDGGHFENMGLYELVKRRCGLIIVCDAEEDGGYRFAGLGNAIRKCRIDLGIGIDLNVTDIAPPKPGKPGKQHCAVGQIHYEYVDVDAPMGTIVYFKASLTGDEPTDVKNYKKTHDAFPHESTIDQWFSESQFESYRQLGYHEVLTSFRGLPPKGPQPIAPASSPTMQKQLFDVLKQFGFDASELPPHGGESPWEGSLWLLPSD